MKEWLLFVFLVTVFFSIETNAQTRDKTILIVRHAEKADAMSPDPELSADGVDRAKRLVKKIGRFKPGAFYSTDFKRTRSTVEPLAKKRGLAINLYDAKKPQELLDEILKSKTKRFLIAGHSNTVPGLVNLITKKNLFKNLDDTEYSVIWLIKFKNGRLKKFELLEY